jgi:hypothetical protein
LMLVSYKVRVDALRLLEGPQNRRAGTGPP